MCLSVVGTDVTHSLEFYSNGTIFRYKIQGIFVVIIVKTSPPYLDLTKKSSFLENFFLLFLSKNVRHIL